MPTFLAITILGSQISTFEFFLAIAIITVGFLWFSFLIGWLWLRRKRALAKKNSKEV